MSRKMEIGYTIWLEIAFSCYGLTVSISFILFCNRQYNYLGMLKNEEA